MKETAITNEYKTQIIGYFKDGSKRVVTCFGRRDYTFAKALIIDIEGRSEHIEKVEVVNL